MKQTIKEAALFIGYGVVVAALLLTPFMINIMYGVEAGAQALFAEMGAFVLWLVVYGIATD